MMMDGAAIGCANTLAQSAIGRTSGLYGHDSSLKLRTATDNDQVAAIYKQYLEDTPNGHEAHRLLHTHYHARPKFVKD